jgi:hypothetical protein
MICISCNGKTDDQLAELHQIYTTYGNSPITYLHSAKIDIDKNGSPDFLVTAVDLMMNDQVHRQFRVVAYNGNKILFNGDDPAIWSAGDRMPINDIQNLKWYDFTSAVLVEKVFSSNTAQSYWQGAWNSQFKKSLAVQLIKDGRHFYGWLRFSYDTSSQEQVILHDALISTTPQLTLSAL